MRLPKAIMQITKVAAAASLCFATSAAIASTAVRPSVKAVAAPALNADLPALPVRAGAPTDESENNIMGLALLPLLGLAVAVVAVPAVVVSDDDDETSPG